VIDTTKLDHKTLNEYESLEGGAVYNDLVARLSRYKDMLVDAGSEAEYRIIQGHAREVRELIKVIENATDLSRKLYEQVNAKRGGMQKAF